MLISSFMLFQKEVENALNKKNKNVFKRPYENIIFETPDRIIDEYTKINELCKQLKNSKIVARSIDP